MRTAGTLALLFMCSLVGPDAAASPAGREGPMTDPALVYERAHQALIQGDYPLAIRIYEALMARYPFAAETRQSRLDVIYAYYRAGESESAIDAADTFISENPTHPRIDYAWYLKGLTDFERMPNFMERWFRVDLNKRPPTQARRSFLSFSTVVEQFPTANTRTTRAAAWCICAIASRITRSPWRVTTWAAAPTSPPRSAPRWPSKNSTARPRCAKRSRSWSYCYDKMELKELAAQTRAMYRNNYEGEAGERRIAPKKKWWKPWAS